ncbi:MAG TPA: divalent-cation tolerance protein CutA [Gemmatimonadales bacterium]|nr:divalent-cation tolerance protein CutA [Gemmatimonadales bacterium]
MTTSVDSREAAARLATAAVAERLAACVQVVGPIRSTYRWRGQVEEADEWYCHCKTTRARYPELESRLRALHPYDVPEIVAVPIVAGSPAYLAWIEDSVRATPTPPAP